MPIAMVTNAATPSDMGDAHPAVPETRRKLILPKKASAWPKRTFSNTSADGKSQSGETVSSALVPVASDVDAQRSGDIMVSSSPELLIRPCRPYSLHHRPLP